MTLNWKTFITVATLTTAGTAFAGGHNATPEETAMKVRKAHMQLYSFNLGILGGMAQDKTPYDAQAASIAAANLAAMAGINQTGYWLDGTDTSVEGSRAKPDIWTDLAGFEEDISDMAGASAALAAVAGDGLDALKAAFGPVGKACGDCHEAYRAPRN